MGDSSPFWVAFWSVFHDALETGVLPASAVVSSAHDGRKRLNPGTALAFAAEVYGYTVEDLLGYSRVGQLTDARALVVWALRQCGSDWSYPAIGRVLGGRDHTSALYLKNKAERLRDDSPLFAGACADLARLFDLSITEREAAPCL